MLGYSGAPDGFSSRRTGKICSLAQILHTHITQSFDTIDCNKRLLFLRQLDKWKVNMLRFEQIQSYQGPVTCSCETVRGKNPVSNPGSSYAGVDSGEEILKSRLS